MPFTLLAHQAPVLPLKLRWPRAFSLTALCIGTIAPDLEYLPRGPVPAGFAHSFVGQLTLCLPLTLVLTLLVRQLAAPAVLLRLGRSLPPLAMSPKLVALLSVSALVGSVSHVLLDQITHPHGFATKLAPWLDATWSFRGLRFRGTLWLQYGFSALLGLSALPLVLSSWRMLRPEATPRPEYAARGLAFVALLTVAGVALGAKRGLRFRVGGFLYFHHPSAYALGYAAFVAFCGGVLGFVLAGLVLAIRDRRRASAPGIPPTATPILPTSMPAPADVAEPAADQRA